MTMTEEEIRGRSEDDPRQNLVNVVTDDDGCALTLCSVLFGQPAETIPEIYEVTIPRDACEAIAVFSARVGPVVIVWMHRGMNHKASEAEQRRQMGACKAVNTLMLRDARASSGCAPGHDAPRGEDPAIGRAWAMLHTIGCEFIHDVV
jgi:hypothetical protein